ncbi:unnamed protein product [Scytosiphon promiscuus]
MDFKELFGVVGRIEEAMEGAGAIKAMMRTRMKDYGSVLQALRGSTAALYEHEQQRLQGLFAEIEALHAKHTASPEDGRPAKIAKIANRGAQHKSIRDSLDAIDRDVVRQFNAIAAKSSVNAEEIKALLANMRPPALPDMAAVPAGVLVLPSSYVERSSFEGVVDDLINPDEAHAPYTLVGMGGQGKTVLASAVVRSLRVRKHFRGGVFWVKVGRDAENGLLSLLQGLARDISAAPTDAPHVTPHAFDSLEEVKQHLAVVASAEAPPRLVVLDDVWESKVVDAFLPLQLRVLVTTRDRSVVGVPGGRLELENMAEDEALELLAKTSLAAGQLSIYVRARMTKVVALCGHLPLAVVIAGSMSVVKGKGATGDAWDDLIKLFENVAKVMRARGEQTTSINMVLGASFDVLSDRKQVEMMKMAVMAPGVVASVEMLLNLWEIQDVEGTQDEAKGLANKCLLQDVSGGGYRVHDLLLEFVRIKIKAEIDVLTRAVERQAQYLRRLGVVMEFQNPEHGAGAQGLYVLASLWRSVEKLSGNPELQVASYRVSLREVDSCKAREHVATLYDFIGDLFQLQAKYIEAEPLYERSQTIREKVLGPEHLSLAHVLVARAQILGQQGRYAEAEPFYERSQVILQKTFGPEHPEVAAVLRGRAQLMGKQGKYAEAEPLFERSRAIQEVVLGPEHRTVAGVLHSQANLFSSQEKFAEAEPLYERSQAIMQKVLGPEHPEIAMLLGNRAELLKCQGRCAEAEPLYERSRAILEKILGPAHPDVAHVQANQAALFGAQGKYAQAEPLFEIAQAALEKVFGLEHPDVAMFLDKRAKLLEDQGKYVEAEPLHERSQAIREVLHPEHPDMADVLSNRAMCLEGQGKYAEAEPLYERSQAIREKLRGPEHLDVAMILSNRAVLSQMQGEYLEAVRRWERASFIRKMKLGDSHPSTVYTRKNLEHALNQVAYSW